MDCDLPTGWNPSFAAHPRSWRDFAYVYAVVSRRSRGLSVGINLNVDQVCNFDCVYCQVNRQRPAGAEATMQAVDLERLRVELQQMLAFIKCGAIWGEAEFAGVDAAYRRLNDIAFSGDGEPTAFADFDGACRLVADEKAAAGLTDVRIVLITNATMLDRARTRAGLAILDANQGEVWAKLDAGTQGYYERIDRSAVPLAKVLANIGACGRERPMVIQTMLLCMHGQAMPESEWLAYVDRLRALRAGGCRIDRVQLYTVARQTAEAWATALFSGELAARASALRAALPGLEVEMFPGTER